MKTIALISLSALLLVGCSRPQEVTSKSALNTQRENASNRALTAQTECNECNSIEFKRTTLGKPGLIGYVVFLADDGRPIQYYTVKGKCTSGGKRLDQSYEFIRNENAASTAVNELVPGPSDDGTYGTSGEYVYCRTTSDAYVQWNGKYLYSSQPFDLTIKPLVIDTSGKEQGQ